MRRSIIIAIMLFVSHSKLLAQDSLVDITNNSSKFTLDIKYATSTNIFGKPLYDCAKCLLRPQVAKKLIAANQYFNKKGYRIKIYDCYRPLDMQKTMWEKIPRATYVANPYKGGSIHNKGAAIDITIETLDGCDVDMGTDYDHFGKEAHIDNTNLSKEILDNRMLLIEGMRKFGFQTIRTEWWHFSFVKNLSYKTLNHPLPCPK